MSFFHDIMNDLGNEVIAGIYDDAERCHGRKPTLNEINHGVKSNSGQKYGGWTDFAGKNNSYKKRPKDPRRKQSQVLLAGKLDQLFVGTGCPNIGYPVYSQLGEFSKE